MGLWNKLRNELIDIVQWLDETPDTMVWRFPRYENEIKYGAQLIVREGQAAAFVNEGKLADVFQPGTYTLQTQNLPILSTLKGWKYGFESPFKAEVYFVSTRVFTDRKWGTKNPIMLRDAEFGPVRLRAFGTFAVQVDDPGTLLKQVVGTNSQFSIEQLNDQLRDLLTARFADVIGSSKIAVLDLAGNYDELGKFVSEKITKDFDVFGVKIVNLLVENVSLPQEVEAALDKRSSMGVIGNMSAYAQYQAANSIEAAAANPSGLAGAGVGMGVGYAMASQMSRGMGGAPSDAAPPPIPGEASFFMAVDGKQAGPFNMAALQEKVKAGALTRGTLVWKNGMVNWTEAGKLPELSGLFAAEPPPLPKQ